MPDQRIGKFALHAAPVTRHRPTSTHCYVMRSYIMYTNDMARAALTTGHTGHVPRGSQANEAYNFLEDCLILFDIVKIKYRVM